jgi:hypothetical protein
LAYTWNKEPPKQHFHSTKIAWGNSHLSHVYENALPTAWNLYAQVCTYAHVTSVSVRLVAVYSLTLAGGEGGAIKLGRRRPGRLE